MKLIREVVRDYIKNMYSKNEMEFVMIAAGFIVICPAVLVVVIKGE